MNFDKSIEKYYYFMFMCVAAQVSRDLGMLIDSLKYAREKQTKHGSLPVSKFERLRDSLFAKPRAGDEIDYEVSGGMDARKWPQLSLKVAGLLQLQCQWCLKALDYELTIDTALRLVPEALLDAEQSDDPEEADCIAASTELDLVALIEDEILLALPAYPRHENGEGGCGSAGSVEGETQTEKQKVSVFSVLEKLGVPKPASRAPDTLKQKVFKSKE
jgi:uncharacterized protein